MIQRRSVSRAAAPATEHSTLGLTAENPIPISRAVPRVAALVDQSCGIPYWFAGELSSLRPGRSGWTFGSVTDGRARLDVRFPRGTKHNLANDAVGRLLLFRGVMQLDRAGCLSVMVVEARSVDTHGARLLAREDLRRRLRAEGLLDRTRLDLPEWPTTIAVVTAARGAAIEDIRTVVARRAPWIRLVVHDAAVHGHAAPASLVRAITAAVESRADVILLTRGGGAAEDLAVFDEQLVVRAVADSKIPVVCAVGHQTDNTLADEIADLSVATPTAAAERITPNRAALASQLTQLSARVHNAAARYGRAKESELRYTARRALPAMTRLLQLLESRLYTSRPEVLKQRVQRTIDGHRRAATDALTRCDRSAESLTRLAYGELHRLRQRLRHGMERSASSAAARLQHQHVRITSLSPETILQRGYAIVRHEAGVCRSVVDLEHGTIVHIHFADGMVTATINSTDLRKKGRAA